MRMTKHRQTILDLLKKQNKPLDAKLISSLLPESSINLATIYRSLETLYEENYVSKSMIDSTAFYHINHDCHHHYAVCLSCKQMIKLDCHLEETIKTIETHDHFKIINHDLTFYGYCQNCQKMH